MKETLILKATDNEQRTAIDVVYEPNKLDAHNQWMSADTIRKACEEFNKGIAAGTIATNLFHLAPTDKFSIIKSWINECDAEIGGQLVPEGTWLIETKYHDQELWELKKANEIQGVSISASGNIIAPKNEEDN